MSHRRNLLAAIGGAALVAPAVPAIASPERVGRVEELCRQLPALTATYFAAQDAMQPGISVEQWEHLRDTTYTATRAIGRTEHEVMATPPETVTDALLILGLGADLAKTAADCDMNDEQSAGMFRDCARASRRAADFLAHQHGHYLGAMLGNYYEDPAVAS